MLAIQDDQNTDKALELSQRLNLPLVSQVPQPAELVIGWHEDKLAVFPQQTGPVYIDFIEGKSAHRRKFGGGKKQPLGRAIGLSSDYFPTVIDATAGMGRDSFVLASLGCSVTMIERSPVIAALLEDALSRASQDAEIKPIIDRLCLHGGDACGYLENLVTEAPDVIYLDPMYPEKKKSAAVKKDMQLLQTLVGKDVDSDQLLLSALVIAKKRVVVKRPRKAPPIEGPAPHAEVLSPNTRYDIYTRN